MRSRYFSELDPAAMAPTRAALHAYARVLGDCLKRSRARRKHWWHASLRPTLKGLSTGVVHAACDFELELNLRDSLLRGRTSAGAGFTEVLQGQSATALAARAAVFLAESGIDETLLPSADAASSSEDSFEGYSAPQAGAMGKVLGGVAAAMVALRAGVREECSPIQLWPHHFDLSMLWLPGDKLIGEDLEDEEQADVQMNFGFTFGDEAIPEPYFYVTAYPLPDELPRVSLPAGTIWNTQGFEGALLSYADLLKTPDPMAYLLLMWNGLLAAGRNLMTEGGPRS